ncbi:MAG TPA: EamA family transporter RarD [Gemmataceae bacterium]|nr:EamA family transporter RarD [Gemmataceae bacterium]
MNRATREGFLYGLAAYVWWGLVPIYFHWLGEVPPLNILAHRIAWSALFIGILLTYARRWPDVLRCFRTPSLLVPLCVSAALVGYNWLMYITAVYIRDIVQASLGYFILPLVSIALALLIFRERLRPLQKLAIVFASVGVGLLTWQGGVLPWLALSLALSFSVYGMIRKRVPVDGLLGLAVETYVLLPLALGYLALDIPQRVAEAEDGMLFKLSLSGIVTAIPLLCFGQAARKLPFSMLGFMQYISPSLQFVIAVLLFRETVTGWLNYGLVWTALVIFSFDSYLQFRKIEEPLEPRPDPEAAEPCIQPAASTETL